MSEDRQVGPVTFELLWFACCGLPAACHHAGLAAEEGSLS